MANRYIIEAGEDAEKIKVAIVAAYYWKEITEIMDRFEFTDDNKIFKYCGKYGKRFDAKRRVTKLDCYMTEEIRAFLIKYCGFSEEEIRPFDDEKGIDHDTKPIQDQI